MEPYTVEDTLQELEYATAEVCRYIRGGEREYLKSKGRLNALSLITERLEVWTDIKKGRVAIPAGQENASFELRDTDPGYRNKGYYSNEHKTLD